MGKCCSFGEEEGWKTVTDVRSFLGFTNQYRKFIPKYAHIAGPLNELISVDSIGLLCKGNPVELASTKKSTDV